MDIYIYILESVQRAVKRQG